MATTPDFFSCSLRDSSFEYDPLTLKAPVNCLFSNLKKTSTPSFSEIEFEKLVSVHFTLLDIFL